MCLVSDQGGRSAVRMLLQAMGEVVRRKEQEAAARGKPLPTEYKKVGWSRFVAHLQLHVVSEGGA
jgi:hypothetical protein